MKTIKICELFAGYGSQALALKRLGYEIHPDSEIVEWAASPVIAYNTLHEPYDENDISEELLEMLIDANAISNDTKKPAKIIKKNKKDALRQAIGQTNNMCDVTRYDIDKQFDLLTYSFPCQDLSNQGSGAGMAKGSGTRSGLLWHVERMLQETEYKPKILLMENVKMLIGKKHINDFNDWVESLESMGYHSKYKILNSAHYGIGQNRERVFMVSFLDKEAYDAFEWPEPSEEKTPFSKHMMSLNEIEHSPWPINERDLYLNEFELLKGQSGNYKLGNHIGDNSTVEISEKLTSGQKDLQRAGADLSKPIYRKMTQCYQVKDANEPQYTLPAGRPMGQEESNKVYSTFDVANLVQGSEIAQPTLMNRGKKPESPKVYQPKPVFDKDNKRVYSNTRTDTDVNGASGTGFTIRQGEHNRTTRKVFNKLDLNNRVNKEENPSQTAMSGMSNTTDQQLKVYQIIQERQGMVRFVRPLEKARIMGLTDEEFWKLYDNTALSTNEIEAMLGNSIVVNVMEKIFANIKF